MFQKNPSFKTPRGKYYIYIISGFINRGIFKEVCYGKV